MVVIHFFPLLTFLLQGMLHLLRETVLSAGCVLHHFRHRQPDGVRPAKTHLRGGSHHEIQTQADAARASGTSAKVGGLGGLHVTLCGMHLDNGKRNHSLSNTTGQ